MLHPFFGTDVVFESVYVNSCKSELVGMPPTPTVQMRGWPSRPPNYEKMTCVAHVYWKMTYNPYWETAFDTESEVEPERRFTVGIRFLCGGR